MKDLIIREAKLRDVECISKIFATELDYICDTDLVKNQLAKLDKNRDCVYVAEINNTVVGFIQIEILHTLYFESMINILALAVDSSYKGNGIGKKLLNEAESWGKSKDISYVRLNSSINRKGAHRFYIKQGYENEKEQLRFLKKLVL